MFVRTLYLQLRGVGTPTISDINRGGDICIGLDVWVCQPVVPSFDDWVITHAGFPELRRDATPGPRDKRLGRIRWDDSLFTKWVREHVSDEALRIHGPRVLLDDGTEIGVDELVGGASTRSTQPAHQLHSN